MKTARKVLSLMLALALVMALAVTASAAGEDKGSITIQNASKGAEYYAYKLFDATVNEDGTGITYTGTVPTGLSDYFEVGTNGQIAAKTDGVTPEMQTALKAWADAQSKDDVVHGTGAGGPLTLQVAYGYYVITSTIDSGAVVTVDSTTPNAEVYDKNAAAVPNFPADAKKATVDNYELGETAEYTLKLDTANWDGAGAEAKQIISYTLSDNLADGGLDIATVTITGIVIGDNEHTYTPDELTDLTAQFRANKTIVIPWADKGANDEYVSRYNNAAQIVITYTGTVIKTGEVENTLSASYKLADDTDKDVDGAPEETIYNSSIDIFKYTNVPDGVNDTGEPIFVKIPLAGAKFVLKNDDGKYYQLSADEKDVSWLESVDGSVPARATVVTSTDAGTGDKQFVGLKDGRYALVEIEAPDGYNKINGDAAAITVDAVTDENKVIIAYSGEVLNNAGTELPATGGIGTTIFTVVGGILMAGAAVLYITKKRSEDSTR